MNKKLLLGLLVFAGVTTGMNAGWGRVLYHNLLKPYPMCNDYERGEDGKPMQFCRFTPEYDSFVEGLELKDHLKQPENPQEGEWMFLGGWRRKKDYANYCVEQPTDSKFLMKFRSKVLWDDDQSKDILHAHWYDIERDSFKKPDFKFKKEKAYEQAPFLLSPAERWKKEGEKLEEGKALLGEYLFRKITGREMPESIGNSVMKWWKVALDHPILANIAWYMGPVVVCYGTYKLAQKKTREKIKNGVRALAKKISDRFKKQAELATAQVSAKTTN